MVINKILTNWITSSHLYYLVIWTWNYYNIIGLRSAEWSICLILNDLIVLRFGIFLVFGKAFSLRRFLEKWYLSNNTLQEYRLRYHLSPEVLSLWLTMKGRSCRCPLQFCIFTHLEFKIKNHYHWVMFVSSLIHPKVSQLWVKTCSVF